jgi:hypothetical protein
MSNNYGEGVSRVLDPATTQFLSVIWQAGLPPLDSEWNLIGDLSAGWDRQKSLLGTPSGWFGNDINPSKDYVTSPSWSNWFQFGRQRATDQQSIMWAVVNGWVVPVTGTKTGDPPGSPDDIDTWNKILLDPPPGSAGDARADFVFLEVWKARIAPYPSTLNKPNGSAIYKYGNVEGGFSYLPDDLLDPAIGEETTERVQLQYRIRVVKGLINLGTNPDGFDPTVVKAQGAQATPPSVGGYPFANMREIMGDPGLWRAGDGTQNVLGTVDGYVYAIPICIVFRRNSILWAGEPAQNLNGGFNRNPTAVDRTGTLTFSTVPTLAADLSASATLATLVSASNIPLPLTPSSAVTIKIDEELITYSSISGTNVNITGRGVQGTAAAIHKAGATITVVSTRPDGLYSDQVTLTDILDLRHAVNPAGFNYHSTLRSNLDKLLKGQLRANWKRTGTDPRGIYLIYEDKISLTPPISLGITGLDGPDLIRMVFSDAAVQQPVEVICKPATFPVSFPVDGTQSWGLQVTSSILGQSVTNQWSIGDQINIPIAQFKTGVPVSDHDQIRFLNDQPALGTGTSSGSYQFIDATNDYVANGVEVGDTLVIFSGPAAGSYTITQVTTTVLTVSAIIPTATSVSYVIRKGAGAVQIRVEGQATLLPQHYFTINPPNPSPTDDLVITLVAGTYPLISLPKYSNLYITTHIQYGSGRGLSRRPDSIHDITLLNPNGNLLHQTEYIQTGNFPLRTAWTALWSKFRGDTYKSLLPVTAEAYADLGSKTVAIAPFQAMEFPIPTPITGSIMFTTAWGAPDPLSLFDHTRYVLLPRHLVPGWGAVEIPIIPVTSGGNFHRGINFMLMSQEGTATNSTLFNTDYINYSIAGGTAAVFSTLNLSTSLPATYNALLHYGSFSYTANYAGIRKFNDDPTVIGALSTARGLGRHGLELPPYYGIARLFAVYEAQDYKTHGSSFAMSGNRSFLGTGATNLLRGDFNGTTFWIEKDVNGDSTFILNAETIDITKSPNVISTFDSGDYIVEACVFGFDRNSFDITHPFKLALSLSPTPSLTVFPNAILPGPLSGSDTALINYSRTPYQGDAWGTETSFSDKGHTQGPLLSADAYNLVSIPLIPNMLTRPNQKPVEVLASVGFITTLGTGRLSGDFSLANVYDIRNVGYEDPTDPSAPYPPLTSGGPRPLVKSGALGSLANYGDLEANPEYLGCTERLPLGALYRDKDFHGSRFSDELSSPLVYLDTAGVGSGVAGLARTSELDQTEALVMPASVSAGVPGDVLVMVDGEPSNYTQQINYRVNRGGSVFVGSGDRPGGEVFATYSRLLGSGKGTRVLVGRAFLVRNAPTSVGSVEVSGGDELMMAITTQVMELGTTPIEAMILLGTNGSSEGYAAADLYRIEGHPIITNHTFYDVDPSTIQLPLGKTIAQITAPSPAPAIPIGAASTVYASDGTRNFWTNIPTLTGLNLLNDLDLGGNIVFTTTNPSPQIYQADAAPGVASPTLRITGQKATATVSTTSSFYSGFVTIKSGEMTSPTPGYHGGSGSVSIASGEVDANLIGNTGALVLSTGVNYGTGSTGGVTVGSGNSSNGTSGNVVISSGLVLGTSGNGGNIFLYGGSITNVSNTAGNGGNIRLQAGSSLAPSGAGAGGNVILSAGSGPSGNGSVDVLLTSAGTQYASFNNLDLVLGPVTVSGNYGIQFTSTTTNPTISQATGTGFGAALTIQAQNAGPGPGDFDGGAVHIISGTNTGTGSVGQILLYNGANTNVRVTVSDTDSLYFGTNLVELGHFFYSYDYSLVFSSKVTNPKIGQKPTNGAGPTLTLKAADVSSVSTGKGGDLRLEAGNALGALNNGGNIVLMPGTPGAGGSTGVVAFDETALTPTITQLDQTSPVAGIHLTVSAQSHTILGWGGGNLRLNGGNGDGGGGNVEITSGTGVTGAGGNVIINTGPGTVPGNIDLNPGSFSGLRVDATGVHVKQGSGNNQGLGFQAANPSPASANDDGELFVDNSTKHLNYISLPAYGTRVISKNVTVVTYRDSTDITHGAISSTSYIDVVSSWSHTFTCLADDIIEGSAYMNVIPPVGFTGDIWVKITFADSVGPTSEDFELKIGCTGATTPGNFYITMPLYYTVPAGVGSHTITVTFQAKTDNGSTGIFSVYPFYTGNKWLNLRQIRP